MLDGAGGAVAVLCGVTWVSYYVLLAGIGTHTAGTWIFGGARGAEGRPFGLAAILRRAGLAWFDQASIVVDVARNPTFPEAEVEKRRSEALTVLRQNEDSPASRAVEGVLELLYTREHPYGRPSKGTADGVERISRADMLGFHGRRIRPGALSIAIVGDIPAEHALSRASETLDGWRTPPPELDVLPVPHPHVSRRERLIPMPGKVQTDIFGTMTPQAAATGARITEILSPTPPVLCLPTLTPGMSDRSTRSPERTIASVSHAVS